jgi:hypothetical protein
MLRLERRKQRNCESSPARQPAGLCKSCLKILTPIKCKNLNTRGSRRI